MKATINFNNELMNFNTIKELKTFLNSALYYSQEVVLFSNCHTIFENYSETNDVRGLVSECNFYDSPLNVVQMYY